MERVQVVVTFEMVTNLHVEIVNYYWTVSRGTRGTRGIDAVASIKYQPRVDVDI